MHFHYNLTKKNLFKMTISERSKELIRKLLFINKFEMWQIMRKGFDLIETTFFGQTIETGQIYRKCLAPHNEPLTAKQSISGIF